MAIQCNFYKNTAEPNVVDKTSYIGSFTSYQCNMLEPCSIQSPSLIIRNASPTILERNYVYLAAFNRYYYVTGQTALQTNLYRIDLRVDVLMSFKDKIKALECIIGRQENSYNAQLIDEKLPSSNRTSIDVIDISADTNIFKTFKENANPDSTEYSYLIITNNNG